MAAGAIAEMGLLRSVHRMIAGIDARHGGNRAELSECRVGNVAVVDDVGIVGERNFEQPGSRADLGIGAEAAVAHLGGGMYQRLGRKSFRAHERRMGCRPLCLYDADDKTMTAEPRTASVLCRASRRSPLRHRGGVIPVLRHRRGFRHRPVIWLSWRAALSVVRSSPTTHQLVRANPVDDRTSAA